MSVAVKTEDMAMELDKAFTFGVHAAWDDLTKVATPCSVRVVYVCEPGVPLDHVSVWLLDTGGYEDLVGDYWTCGSSTHSSGLRFANQHHSGKLAQSLDFIMKNQGKFARALHGGRHSMVLMTPPDEENRIEAAMWIRGTISKPLDDRPSR